MKILWVKSWKINNNQIRYFHINSGTTTKQIFSLLHTVQGDNKYEIEELMNDCATKFIASEEIKLTDNQDNAVVFTSEVNVYVVDKRTTYTKWLKTNEKRKNLEENTWKDKVSVHFQEKCLLEGRAFYRFYESASVLTPMNKLLILLFWLNYLFNKATSIQTKREELSHQCWGHQNFHWCQLHHGCKANVMHTSELGLWSFRR